MASASVVGVPVVMSAYEKFLYFRNDPEMRAMAEEWEEELLRREDEADRREAMEKKIKRAEARIKTKAKAEGKAEGLAEERKNLAKSMKSEGADWAYISRITKLTIPEIQKL